MEKYLKKNSPLKSMESEKEKIRRKLKDTYCRLRPSGLHGVGVFAIRDIPANVDPFPGLKEQEWHEFNISELKDFDEEILKMVDDFYVVEKDGAVLISDEALNGLDPSFFINNSDSPNLKVPDEQAKRKEGYTFITTRTIKKGEELTVAYKTYDSKFLPAGGGDKAESPAGDRED